MIMFTVQIFQEVSLLEFQQKGLREKLDSKNYGC